MLIKQERCLKVGIIKHFQDYPDDKIDDAVNEKYPSKPGFGSVNEEERDAYREGLEEGFELGRDDY